MAYGFNVNWTVLEPELKEGVWKASSTNKNKRSKLRRGGLHVSLHADQQASFDEERANHGMTWYNPYGLMCRHWQLSVALAWPSTLSLPCRAVTVGIAIWLAVKVVVTV